MFGHMVEAGRLELEQCILDLIWLSMQTSLLLPLTTELEALGLCPQVRGLFFIFLMKNCATSNHTGCFYREYAFQHVLNYNNALYFPPV